MCHVIRFSVETTSTTTDIYISVNGFRYTFFIGEKKKRLRASILIQKQKFMYENV